ncbi:MAG: DUF11 domain-containing protein [Opitutales bacterium]|nr:DUF11 domain-containing protein [Opitutales bacterium]MCH8540285.1 DUF11 domain-containing protein [Opitutales bacterium]
MDVGGVWDGTQEITPAAGDTLTLSITNTGDEPAYSLGGRVPIPSGFSYIVGTEAVSSSGGIDPDFNFSMVGSELQFNLVDSSDPTSGYDLPAGESLTITFDITADSAVSGTFVYIFAVDYEELPSGGPTITENRSQSVLVQEGATVITVTPKDQEKAVGEVAEFTINVTNTGLGGLFDLTIEQTSINPGNNLALQSLVQSAPGSPVATLNVDGDILTLPYLGTDEEFEAEVTAEVLSCGSIVNIAVTNERMGNFSDTDQASVLLDLNQPLINFSTPVFSLVYGVPVSVSIPLENTGAGDARNFVLDTTLPARAVTITNVHSDWIYDDGSGEFILLANSGTIANGTVQTLTFDVQSSDICTSSGAGNVFYQAFYENACADQYVIPQTFGSIGAPSDSPSINLSKTVSAPRIAIQESGFFTLTVSGSNLNNLQTDPLVIADTLPDGITYFAHTATHGSVLVNGQDIEWTVDLADVASSPELEIDFEVDLEPCLAGDILSNSASVSAVSTEGCTLDASASASFLVSNNPGLESNQFFEVGSPAGNFFEAGLSPIDYPNRDSGEGEAIPFELQFEFGATYPGTWNGSRLVEDFGGISQQALIQESLVYELNGGGEIAVPSSAVTILSTGFEISLDFLGNEVAGDTIVFRYATTIPDEAISGVTRSVTQRATLFLEGIDANNLPDGICEETVEFRFTQGVFYTVGRAAASLNLSFPSILEVCKEETLTLTLSNQNDQEIENPRITLENGGTAFIIPTGQTPVYGGDFNSGNITFEENGGVDPTFTFTGGALPDSGTIQLTVIRDPVTQIDSSGFSASVDYDSWQTGPDENRVYQSSASYSPLAVRKAELAVTVTPGTVSVLGETIKYRVYISNTDAGTAFGSIATITLPSGMLPDEAAMNAINPGPDVVVNGAELFFDLENIPSGQTRQIKVVGLVDSSQISDCAIPITDETIEVSWGCQGEEFAKKTKVHPSFFFPSGRLQTVHDTTQSQISFCGGGLVAVTIRNTGASAVQNIVLEEVLPSAAGIGIVPGSVQYSINGGSLVSGDDPSISGDIHTWTSAEIPPLAQLVPSNQTVDGNTDNRVRIVFELEQSTAVAGQSPTLNAVVTGELACGGAPTSPGENFLLPVFEPEINLTKVGRNITAGDTSFGTIVYGGDGDEIEWRITVQNVGSETAQFFFLTDELSGSGGTATISGGSLSGVAFSAGIPVQLDDLPAGDTGTYFITEILGDTCVDNEPEASVEWGCGAPGDEVSEPGNSSDTARINMVPEVLSGDEFTQTIEPLSNGRSRVTVTIENSGGTLYNPVVTASIPSYAVFDDTGPVEMVQTSSDITTVAVTDSSANAPEFTLTGSSAPHILRFGETIAFSYYIRPDIFDTNKAESFPDLAEVETAPGLDPALPSTEDLSATVDFTNSCGTPFTQTVDNPFPLLLPDLDIDFVGPNGGNHLLSGPTTQDYFFHVRNTGPSGSVAENIEFTLPDLGSGWTFNSATLDQTGVGGSGGNSSNVGGVETFTSSQIGTLAAGENAIVRVNLTFDPGNTGNLRLRLRSRGEARSFDGTVTGNYALDQRAHRVIAVQLEKELIDSTEPTTTGPRVLIGEDLTWRVRAEFRGGEGVVENINLVDQLRRGAGTGSNQDNFGFIPDSGGAPFVRTTGNHNATGLALSTSLGSESSTEVISDRLSFTIDDLSDTATADGVVVEFELDARVMNVGNNSDNATRSNRLGLQFDYLGVTYHPPTNNNSQGLTGMATGGIAFGDLFLTDSVNIRRPQLDIVKEVRNITLGETGFSASTSGEADDEIEYRLTVTNPAPGGERPLHNLRVTDTVSGKFELSSSNQGADTSGDGDVDVANTGTFSGVGETIIFDQGNTSIGSTGQDLEQLNPGETLVLLYRGILTSAVNPDEEIENEVSATGFSIPHDFPDLDSPTNQLEPKGDPGNSSGALVVDASDEASVVIDSIDQEKIFMEASEPGSTFPEVVIGEQIRYRIAVVLPQGTSPDFVVQDRLPEGLALLETPVVTIGPGISDDSTQPTITPGALPASGDPLTIEWDFGTRVASGSETDRTVIIEYITQVQNIPGNERESELLNEASYSFGGTDSTDLNQITAEIQEPNLTFNQEVRNVTRGETGFSSTTEFDAGDVLEFRVQFSNTGAPALSNAYDLNLVEELPAGLTYEASSTSTIESSGLTGTLGEPDINGQELVWGREQTSPVNLDLGTGAEVFAFVYRATVDDTTSPLQVYETGFSASWASLDGDPVGDLADLGVAHEADDLPLGRRIYEGDTSLEVTAFDSTTIAKSASGDTLPGPEEGFRIGDIVTYTITMDIQEGTLDDFRLTDVLPDGMVFLETVSLSPVDGDDGFSYTAPVSGSTAPETLDTGILEWNFGTVVNTGDNDDTNNELTLVYTARVSDDATNIPAEPTEADLENAMTLTYEAADGATLSPDPAAAEITARQPLLTIAQSSLDPPVDLLGFRVVRPDETAEFRVVVENTGDAPAYNSALKISLPIGLRGTEPVITAQALGGDPVTLAPETFTAGDDEWVILLGDSQVLEPGQSLEFDFEVTVDTGATKGATLEVSSEVEDYFSLPSGDAEAAHRRSYGQVGPESGEIVVGLRIDGFVYEDANENDVRDSGEDWSGVNKPTVWVNLLVEIGGADQVFRTEEVPEGDGDFAFDHLPPGNYRIILTDGSSALEAQRPANWLFQEPDDGLLDITINQGTGDLVDQNLGLIEGPFEITDAPTISKTASGGTLPLSSPDAKTFRIGDLVTYTIDIFPHEGENENFVITDELPNGLAFHDTVEIVQVSGPPRFSFTNPVAGTTAPDTGDEDTISWDLGTLQNAIADPADNLLRLVYRARVIDSGDSPLPVPDSDPATDTSDDLTNSAEISYDNSAIDPDPLSAGPDDDEITVFQPRLTIAKERVSPSANNLVSPGNEATFRLTVANNGSAPAYNVTLRDTLPSGMRQTTPSLLMSTLNGDSVGGSLSPTYSSGNGQWEVSLADGQPLLPGEEWVVDVEVTVDSGATPGSVLTNDARIMSFASQPTSSPDERRVYAEVGPDSEDLIVGISLAGFVYHQIIPNGIKDPSEDWTTGVPVTLNLITNTEITLPGLTIPEDTIFQSIVVTAGPGDYLFNNLPPGDFRLVITDNDSNLSPVVPSGWAFDTPLSGQVDSIELDDANLTDQNLGLYEIRQISGQVYRDFSPYRQKQAGADWNDGTNVVVNLIDIFDGANTVVDSQAVNAGGSGEYEFTDLAPGTYRIIVAPAGQTTATTASAPSGFAFMEPRDGVIDELVVTFSDPEDQDFGLAPPRDISGFVYDDVNLNDVRDAGEDWTDAPAVYINLVDLDDGLLVASALVDDDTGFFEFLEFIPGNYRLVLTNSSTSLVASEPGGWLFQSPDTGDQTFELAEADQENRNFGLIRVRVIEGVVFLDTGIGGGVANDGERNGGENGLGNVRVRLLEGATVLSQATTGGGGAFILSIPPGTTAGTTLTIEKTNPGAHLSTGAQVGTTGGTYDRDTDQLIFTYPGGDLEGIEMGVVPENAFLNDGSQSILPGAVAFYRHSYFAKTSGTVTFTLSNQQQPTIPWSRLLYQDLACNGQISGGDPIIEGVPITVTAGEEICLILRETAPQGAPFGAKSETEITATFSFDNATPPLPDDLRVRRDVTIVAASGTPGLSLTKEVDKATAAPGETITYTITYTNDGSEDLQELFIFDRTPAWTSFDAASSGSLPDNLTGVTITDPGNEGTGAIQWEFSGTLGPGQSGTVTFSVVVDE